VEEDNLFTIFPYHLSQYMSMDDLLDTIMDSDGFLDDIDKWLKYFPQGKASHCSGDLYTPVIYKSAKVYLPVLGFHRTRNFYPYPYSRILVNPYGRIWPGLSMDTLSEPAIFLQLFESLLFL